jgi:replicative DNA helicase
MNPSLIFQSDLNNFNNVLIEMINKVKMENHENPKESTEKLEIILKQKKQEIFEMSNEFIKEKVQELFNILDKSMDNLNDHYNDKIDQLDILILNDLLTLLSILGLNM